MDKEQPIHRVAQKFISKLHLVQRVLIYAVLGRIAALRT